MDRRTFLKNWSMFVSGMAVFRAFPASGRTPAATDTSTESFHLTVLTAQPDRVIQEVEPFLNRSRLMPGQVNFSEHYLPGRHLSDATWVQNGELIDFRKAKDDLARKIQRLVERLELHQPVDNPALLRFSSPAAPANPTKINIYRGNVLMDQIDVSDEHRTYTVPGRKGQITLSVQGRSVRIIDASCKHKTCVKMGSIHAPGQHLICIPNGLRITIEGEARLGLDGTTY